MNNAKRILIAIDDSDASYRAVTYVGSIIGGREDFRVCLLHALPPLPRELLEFGGASDPQQEEQEEAHIKAEQFREAHVPMDAVETQIVDTVNTQDTVLDILEAARAQQWGTVVVGRESFHSLKALVTSHVGATLIRQAQGLTIWVVE